MIGQIRSGEEKPILIAVGSVLGVALIVGGIVGFQFMKMMDAGADFAPPPATVTTAVAERQTWEITLTSVGSVAPVEGVTVAAEMPGKVERIAFEPGTTVDAGTLLVQQDVAAERARLRSAEARAELAAIDLARMRELRDKGLTSKAEYDRAKSEYDAANAEVDNIRAAITKKSIRAPFAGRLGTRDVYRGQYLRAGDPLVSLQALESVLINFTLPQRALTQLEKGQTVRVTGDTLDGDTVEGAVTAINPAVDAASRNVSVQAAVDNAGERLLPGMFVDVEVVLPEKRQVLAAPATAILHAPYGASVFIVEDNKEKTEEQSTESDGDDPGKTVNQQFVKLGENRGDYVEVTSGLDAGRTLVSTGVFKLRNGQSVVVNNENEPDFQHDPKPEDS